MRNRCGIHEAFMNRSRMILPRVGVGVGGGGGVGGVGHSCLSSHWQTPAPVDNSRPTGRRPQMDARLRREFGGGW